MKIKLLPILIVILLAACGTPQRVVVLGKQDIPAHEEVTPAGPGFCCAFDFDLNYKCGMHLNCPEVRRQVPEKCVLTVKGDGCKAEEVNWPCNGFDKIQVGDSVTATVYCESEK